MVKRKLAQVERSAKEQLNSAGQNEGCIHLRNWETIKKKVNNFLCSFGKKK